MTMKILMMLNLLTSFLFINMKSPLSSNLMIMAQSILLTLMMNFTNKTSWISFMLFILYIGGLMIIFLYISSIAFNEFNMMKKYKNLMMKFLIMMILILYNKKSPIIENFKFENNFKFEDNFFLMNMFIAPNNLMIYFIMMILFYMLILIIWMLKNNKGPIRQNLN
uniref:NADH-ubiquinone oxidoreductase chain 6 n=1 Tax=Adelges tsugae TaxID=357502 RepID=A0A6M3WA11_ADETS|nr:NADH dehydrogenase subunit 6 [Adelges tsugae]